MTTPLSYPEAIIMGAVQGISELFPISSLGHAVIIPALVGGQWASDLSVSAPESPYLAFIVGLHVATALALLLFFWRDWVRIIGGFVTSIRYRRLSNSSERLAWLIILATIPVGIIGLLLEHTFRTVLGTPLPAAAFLAANGVVLLVGELVRRRGLRTAEIAERTRAESGDERDEDVILGTMSIRRGVLIGTVQSVALLPGISRSGVTMVAGMAAGLTHREAARFSFLLATPVIFAAGLLKLPDLFGPLGAGIHGQVLAGSAAAFVCALFAVAFLDRYFRTRTLIPFAVYSLVAGVASFLVLLFR
ncbi:undecaprenyl-diphosphate phosphatase [Galbitalea soli]|uniref:Undecaprenyl-diphosphatase n=1 Tax=Galbitalea soli TaxID=1268042 RepID=A0A7C9TRR7_9MICO|nr:undecaprenyl-diphosphate phosphatase [Galbitalea soli]NEM92417.1 undecaprenyl-diphosphate phosphatase [Galbitalea soli]NYJ29451.1 undecaprenyl-diphosphatase [Galbitalea soli]